MPEQQYRYTLHAVVRDDHGKGASRRLRRQGMVPAIVYGGEGDPLAIAIKQDELVKNAKHVGFFSQIVNLKVEGKEDTEVLVRDVQHHVFKPIFQHFDFQRIVQGQNITATIPLNFIGEEIAPGVKEEGGIISREMISLEITCRPSKIPETIDVDMSQAVMGTVIHLADIVLPEGVELSGEWSEEELAETAVAQVIYPQRGEESGEEDAVEDLADSESEDEEKSDD